MQQDTGKRSLEGYKIFPYIAWALTAGFAFFVYNITTELQDVTSQLQVQTDELQKQVQQNDPNADFDAYNASRFKAVTSE